MSLSIKTMISYVRSQFGDAAYSLFSTEEVANAVVESLSDYRAQAKQAKKPISVNTAEDTLTTQSGVINNHIVPAEIKMPDYVRVKHSSTDDFHLIEIAETVAQLEEMMNRGEEAILIYDDPLKYSLSWEPATGGETFEFWFDDDLGTIGKNYESSFPKEFDFMVGTNAVLRLCPLAVHRDESLAAFIKILQETQAAILARREQTWNFFLFQPSNIGSTGRFSRFRLGRGGQIRRRGFPY